MQCISEHFPIYSIAYHYKEKEMYIVVTDKISNIMEVNSDIPINVVGEFLMKKAGSRRRRGRAGSGVTRPTFPSSVESPRMYLRMQ